MRAPAFLSEVRSRVSLPWLTLAVVLIAVIWGNSLVPGEGSGNLSLGVVEAVRSILRSCGLPYEWLTNFVVRKTAHFTEYLVLGCATAQAFDPNKTLSRGALFSAALLCVLVPGIDETIQLFVPGRAGQIADVLIDCSGAATGIALRSLLVYVRNRFH